MTALLVYGGLRYLAPAVAGTRPLLAGLAQIAVSSAPWLAAVFLLPVPFAIARAVRAQRLLSARPTLDQLHTIAWQDFERLVAAAYAERGYKVTERGGSGPDGGIDLELRSKGKILVVQCKRWRDKPIGVELVRALYGAMTGDSAHGAVFVTTGAYTPAAIDFARNKPIELVDGRTLARMISRVEIDAQVGADGAPESRPALVVTRDGAMRCPLCGSPMTRRVSRQGSNPGTAFWGCTRFPNCRGTRNA